MSRTTTATAIVGLVSTAALTLGVLGAASAGAAVSPGPPSPTPPHVPRPCLPASCPRTTSIQISHPKNNELVLHSTWHGAQPASVTYAVSCDDGFALTTTVYYAGQYVDIPRVAGDPGIESCTASQTIPAGWSTTASFTWFAQPGPPTPPFDYAYDIVGFDSVANMIEG